MLPAGRELSGVGIGLGSATGEVLRISSPKQRGRAKHSGNAGLELQKLDAAIAGVLGELNSFAVIANQVEGEILEAISQMLSDPELHSLAIELIDAGYSADTAILQAAQEFANLLAGDESFAERAKDLMSLARQVADRLSGVAVLATLYPDTPLVLVAEDFSPTEVSKLPKNVVAVIATAGGPTSHSAIMLRSRGLPALLACPEAAELVDGQSVLVDPVGNRALISGDSSMATAVITLVPKQAEPIIPVRANIGSLEDAVLAAATSAKGVGLFRTELLYLNHPKAPSAQVQAEQYAEVLAAAPDGPVVIRTVDTQSDKPVPFLAEFTFETWEPTGYELLARNRSFVVEQLRSIEAARIQSGREVWVMAPMINSVSEASEFVALAKSLGGYRVGIMVETPNLVSAIADLAPLVDFVSVGTNDLSRFLFAADRTKPGFASVLDHWQPKLVSALAEIGSAAHQLGLDAAVCGESASDSVFAVVLAGLGFSSVSASLSQVAAVRNALSSVTQAQAKLVAAAALQAKTAAEARAFAEAALRQAGS